ncbi:MAG: Gfo/Idh/MocA family oxidoreductase [Rhodobacteraceae bacterium]|nr:Gfo/Idh/MocA family oxidoreductase [Paracoccaceae bacterium]MCY4139810.1 Gfo/Idh/MocA family oxidoreductase [Paracoccaceae bacterium]
MSLRVAIVGMGGIGDIHAGVYDTDARCQVVAVCDICQDKAAAAGQRFGCPSFTSVDEMVARTRIDIASVCTAGTENGGDHYEPTMALLNAGIAILGEKPISNEIPKAREMVALAEEKGLRYGINLNHRFTPAAIRARKWVDDGRLGEVNIINMTMWIDNPIESSPHFHMRALHPHSIDVMRHFCGDVTKVHAFFKRGSGRKIWSNVQANMLFENGVIGHLTGSYDAGGSFGLETLEVVGSDARFVLREACEHLEFYPRRSKQVETYSYLGDMMGFSETFRSRITRWIDQNAEGVDPDEIDGSAMDALKAQLVIEAAIESWETGQVVEVEKV